MRVTDSGQQREGLDFAINMSLNSISQVKKVDCPGAGSNNPVEQKTDRAFSRLGYL